MRRPISGSISIAACLVAALIAGPARPAAQGGAADQILIDFRAVADDGTPVVDLKPADVTLRVGGKPREIRSLELVKVGGATAAPVAASKAPAPFITNARAASTGSTREILIMVDDEAINPGREQPIREGLLKFLDSLTPADRVGVLTARPGRLNVGFTQKHDDVRAAINKFAGMASARESASDYVCRAVMAVQSIRNGFSSFSPNAVPTLVYVSGALSGPNDQRIVTAGVQSDLCQLRTRDFEEVGNIAQSVHANVYIVHVLDSTTVGGSSQAQQAGLDNLAGVSGGEMIRFSGGADALGRIAKETSAFYLASFIPEAADRNGARQRVEVRVARDGVKVNARPHIAVGKSDAAPSGAKPVTPRDMIRVSDAFTGLPLRAATFAARNPNGKPQTLVIFEPAEPGTKLNAAMVGLYDAKGSLKGQWTATNDDLGKTPIMSALLVDPGQYRMRIAATDAAGRPGTLDSNVTVDLPLAGPLKMSALLLGVPVSGAPLAPKLEFDANDAQVVAYMEVYGAQKGANVGVTFELAESEDGPAGGGGSIPLADGPSEDVKIARAGFGIGQLQPGDIVVRAIVTMDGKPIGRVVRTLRKK